MALSLTAYDILMLLVAEDKTAILNSMTILEMIENPKLNGVSQGTIYTGIDYLLGSGYVARGVKVKTANTYYITKEGLQHLADATGLTIAELKEELRGGKS